MFDFSKINFQATNTAGFKAPATDVQITELEKYCGHTLPENLKFILKNYNGGAPAACYFDVPDPDTGILLEWELNRFYVLDDNEGSPINIWGVIKNNSEFLEPNAIPFAEDYNGQIYYLKWKNNIPQVWFLGYVDLEEPETQLLLPSFDELLKGLYAK